ncbi:MAG TPA: Ig-like domain-containing protein [Bacteroidales bacterium]|nr:Ig-like domain-containing protein [Bacteroidales bacterium]HNS47717.1 Ig-like domain-containing protein [Bacteroidales bacterium]
MKSIKTIFTFFLVALLAASCEDYLDPIKKVPTANDVSVPQVTINFPTEGKVIQASEEVATLTIHVIATDDIELKSVTLQLDGEQIASLSSFKDYRRADIAYDYTELTDGDHSLTVRAEDLTGKNETKTVNFSKITIPTYEPLDGEVLYFPFDGHSIDLISQTPAALEGTPGFATGKVGEAYAGATDAYLTYPADSVTKGSEFSVSFWYKINADPPRGGILAISPPGESRNSGLRLFRENSGDNQNIGLNFGIGEAEVWINPVTTVPPTQDWMHIVLSISTTHTTIYIDGAIAVEQDIDAQISWTDCTSISIASGMPNFGYWEHYSDLSLYDEMHFFTKALTAEEVQSLFAVK